jgi:murein DD-endopeptidase MepM/ murein hydrolase activator NlpD
MDLRKLNSSSVRKLLDSDLFRQTVAAVVLVLVVFGIYSVPWPVFEPAQHRIEQVLTDDYDFSGVLDRLRGVEVRQVIARVQNTLGVGDSEPRQGELLAALEPPVSGTIVSGFGWQTTEEGAQKFHEGLDIAAPGGSLVLAVHDGVVARVKDDDQGGIVVLDHGSGVETTYGKLGTILVAPGQSIKQGEPVAVVPHHGDSTVLYFELRVNGKATDPTSRIYPQSGS